MELLLRFSRACALKPVIRVAGLRLFSNPAEESEGQDQSQANLGNDPVSLSDHQRLLVNEWCERVRLEAPEESTSLTNEEREYEEFIVNSSDTHVVKKIKMKGQMFRLRF
jgi:hypothetical protein